MKITIPKLSLVLLVGASGAGKSTFARKHFRPTEVVSSDACRGWVADDETDQSATPEAFEILHLIVAKRLARGRLTVVDATNVQPEARKPLVALARQHYVQTVAVVFDLPEGVLAERNRQRPDRQFGAHVLPNQVGQLRRSLARLEHEGLRNIWVLRAPEEVDSVYIERRSLRPDRRFDHGPFDIIGDIHGCAGELEELLGRLGYAPDEAGVWRHPQRRKVVFLGDLADRGPRVPDVFRIAMAMVRARVALCVPGNHDEKLRKWLEGRKVRMAHGLEQSAAQLEREPPELRARIAHFLDGMVSHYVLDGGRLVVAHAGMKEEMQGRTTGRVREFALFGETTGEIDDLGLPVRLDWAADYRGAARVVYGHTPVAEPRWLNGTINIDTGCVFGGRLTALRYPELELVSVPARHAYAGTRRQFLPPGAAAPPPPQETGPPWRIYLPPPMAAPEPSRRPGFLEHPEEAFAYYRREGIGRVVCEEKHRGTRAVVILCRDEYTAQSRFGLTGGEAGLCYTRGGRRLFSDPTLEKALLARLRSAMDRAALWDRWGSDWVGLDGELMPWQVGSRERIQRYAAVGAAARSALPKAVARLAETGARGIDTGGLLAHFRQRYELAGRYVEAYRRHCWRVASVKDLRLAPFHLLATEGADHRDKDHLWHLETLGELLRAEPEILRPTRHLVVDLADPAAEAEAVRWWEELIAAGGDGVMVKPLAFQPPAGVQPALKCRSPQALRLVHGPDYSRPENLERLRESLTAVPSASGGSGR